MKKSKPIFLIFPILGWGFATLLVVARDRKPQPDKAIVMGTVLDAASMTLLPGVEVSFRSQKVTSDKTGHYQIEVPYGVREISFSAPNHPPVRKLLIVRQPGSRVRQDALLPNSPGMPPKVLALDRGSRVGPHGKDLDYDVPADSNISLADEYGNHDQLLTLNAGQSRAHSPVCLNATTIAYGKEGLVHDAEKSKLQGVFQFQSDSSRIQQMASELGIRFLSKSPQKDALAIVGDKDLYILGSLSNPASLRRIFGLDAHEGFLLSLDWAADDRIYFTVDDQVLLDDRHYLNHSRIASIKVDGTDLRPAWASDPQYSYRYPMNGEGAEIIFCRFALDGSQQTLWSRNIRTGKTQHVAEPALRAVYMDSGASRLYYIYRQDLHLRDLKTGADWVIVNSVKEADYLRPISRP